MQMHKFFQIAYWFLLAAGIAVALLLGSAIWGAMVSGAALLCSFAWPNMSTERLQKVCLAATLLCFIGALSGGFAHAGLLWAGVAVFGFLTLTVKL